MSVNVDETVEFVENLLKKEKVQTTVIESLKGGLAVGLSATAGFLLFGPIGLAIGASVGGIGAAVATQNKFSSLPQALKSMTPSQKAALSDRVKAIMKSHNTTDLATFKAILADDSALRQRIVQELTNFISKQAIP